MFYIVLAIVALVLAVIEVIESRGLSKLAWAVTILAALVVFTEVGFNLG